MNTIKLEITPHEADLVLLGLDALITKSAELTQKVRDQAMSQATPQLETITEDE